MRDQVSDSPRKEEAPGPAERTRRLGAWAIGPRAWVPILIVALAARLPGLADKPLWYDESLAVLLAAKGPAALIRATLSPEEGVAANVHPLGYFTLLWAWTRAFGTSPVAVRSLSVTIGLAVVGVGYLFARRAFDVRLAGIFGWMLALSPFQVHYAQEVRMYGLLALALVGAASFFWMALREGSWWHWLGFAVLIAAAQYTHALAALFVLPLCLVPVVQRRWRAVAHTAVSGILALILYAPWLIWLPAQVARVRQAYWIGPPGATELVRTLLVYLGGSPLRPWALPVVLFGLILLLLAGGLALWRARSAGDATLPIAGWTSYLSLAPLLLMFLVSQWQPIYLDRAMLPAGIAFLLWIAWSLSGPHLRPATRWTAWALTAACFAVGLHNYYTYRGFPYAPFRELVSTLAEQPSEPEVIVHSNKITAIPAAYYAPGLEHRYLADPPGSGSDTLGLATQQVLGMIAVADVPRAVAGAPGVWFVVFRREMQEYADMGYPVHPALAWLRANFESEGRDSFGEIEVYHFFRRR